MKDVYNQPGQRKGVDDSFDFQCIKGNLIPITRRIKVSDILGYTEGPGVGLGDRIVPTTVLFLGSNRKKKVSFVLTLALAAGLLFTILMYFCCGMSNPIAFGIATIFLIGGIGGSIIFTILARPKATGEKVLVLGSYRIEGFDPPIGTTGSSYTYAVYYPVYGTDYSGIGNY